MPKGSKTCPSCNATCGPRSFTCKHCGADFIVKGEKKAPKQKIVRKIKPKALRVVDWANLQTGTRFKITNGSGPYYLRNGERTYMSEKGYYTVQSILKDGIMGIDDNGYTNFIYMGEEKPSPNIPNLVRSPHRIYTKNQ